MDWLHHPAYQPAREALLQRLAGSVFSFKRLRPVVFLCGKQKSHSRDTLYSYLQKHHPDVFVFYAEKVWTHVAKLEKSNALEMENELGHLSDLIVILVESPGTFTELGAFSLHENLRPKLLPIIDRQYRHDASFINSGPVAWIDDSSRFSPTIYTNLKAILGAAAEISRRLDLIPESGRLPRVQEQLKPSQNPKRLLFFLCDLIAIIGPASLEHCHYYLDEIFGEELKWNTPNLLGLALSLNLINTFSVADAPGQLYYRPLENGRMTAFQKKDFIDLAEERAKVLWSYQKIPPVRELLKVFPDGGSDA